MAGWCPELRAASEAESRLTPTPSPVIRVGGGCYRPDTQQACPSVNVRDRETRTRFPSIISSIRAAPRLSEAHLAMC